MTLPTSGPISLFSLQSEFGGATPIGMNEYYRGGGLVDPNIIAGTGSFQTDPMTPNGGPVLIPSSGTIQASHFYGTQSLIVGNSGIISAPVDSDVTSDFVDVTLPAGVDLIRFFLVGAGGGGGGNDTPYVGGTGGGGSTFSGTINTSWAGPVNVARTLRFFIGRGGNPGRSNTTGDSWASPALPGGHGYGMFGIQSTGSWGAWMNQYAVTPDMVGGVYTLNAGRTARSMYFPNTGTYTFQFQVDNTMSIAVDGSIIADTSGNNDQAANTPSSYLLGSPLTRTISLSAGHHKVVFNYTNTGSIGGYAVRIVNNSAGEFWTTRYDYSGGKAYPTGGTNGYSGGTGASGYGGAGGSATMFSIITSYGEYFVAIAGGGGGGGGAGHLGVLANISQNANWCNQGWTLSAYPSLISGGDGEHLGLLNNGVGDVFSINTDGGGGGAGGGGITNARQYVQVTNKDWLYSGFGGRTDRGLMRGTDGWADGGESGKSGITSYATRYADVMHIPTSTRFPINPTNPSGLPGAVLSTLNSYGHGGDYTIAGTNGAAYVDWGVVGASVPAPSVSRATIRGAIIPYVFVGAPQFATSTSPGHLAIQLGDPNKTIVFDAFGGGGDPGTEYTYYWTNLSGGATISSPNAYRTSVTFPGVISSGAIRCIVSDATSSSFNDYSWEVVQDDVVAPPSCCFPAGAMVLMADGTTKAIETVKAGDSVMSVQGPVKVVQMDTPILGTRKLLTFSDGHTWSEEHSHWTRDVNGAQWWWASNADMWRAEAAAGLIGGLLDNNSMRTGNGFEFAHVDGWKNNVITQIPAAYDMPLFLPVTNGAPIIVDGYLVGAGLNEHSFDYKAINWDVNRTTLTPTTIRRSGAVQPPVVVAPSPFPANWAPPPVPWTLPTAP